MPSDLSLEADRAKLAPSRLAIRLFCIDLEVPGGAISCAICGRSKEPPSPLSKTKGTAMECSDVTRKGALLSGLYGLAGAFMRPKGQ